MASSSEDEPASGRETATRGRVASGAAALQRSVAVAQSRVAARQAPAERTGPGATLLAAARRYRRLHGGLLSTAIGLRLIMMLIPLVLLLAVLASHIVYDTGLLTTTDLPIASLIRSVAGDLNGVALSAGAVAILGILWGGSQFFVVLEAGAARMYETQRRRKFVHQRLLAFLLLGTLIVAFLALALGAVVLEAIPAAGRPFVQIAGGVLIIGGFFLGIYRLLPTVPGTVRDVLPGVAVAAVGMTVVSAGWPLYMRFGTNSALVTHRIFVFTTVLTAYVFILSTLLVFALALNAELYARRHPEAAGAQPSATETAPAV